MNTNADVIVLQNLQNVTVLRHGKTHCSLYVMVARVWILSSI